MLKFFKKFLTATVKNKTAIEFYDKQSRQQSFSNTLLLTAKLSKVKIVLFLVLFVSFLSASAQRDLITTQAGEPIRCKILDETPTRFVYAYLSKSGKVLRNEIFKSLVSDFKYNYYSSDLVDSKGRPIKTPDKVETKPEEPVVAKEEKASKRGTEPTPTKKADTKPNKVETAQKEIPKNDAPATVDTKKTTANEKSSAVNSSKTPKDESVKNTKAEDKKATDKKADDKMVAKTNNTETPKSQTRKQPVPRPSAEKKDDAAQPEKPVIEKEMAKNETEEKQTTAPAATTTAQPQKNEYKNYLKFRVGARGGFASMLKKTPLTDEYSKYKQGLESGWMFGADAAYFPLDNFGIGVMYSNFQSSNDSKSIKYTSLIDPTKADLTGAISDHISSKFLGVPLFYRKNIDYKTFLVLGVAPGMNFYSNKRTEGTSSINVSGKQFGGAATLGVDFLLGNDIIGRDIILSIEGGYNYAKYNQLDYGKGLVTLATPQDNSHWSITIGLRFTRYPKYLRLTSY